MRVEESESGRCTSCAWAMKRAEGKCQGASGGGVRGRGTSGKSGRRS